MLAGGFLSMVAMQIRRTCANFWSMKCRKSFRRCFLFCKIYSVFHHCRCIKASKVHSASFCMLTENLSQLELSHGAADVHLTYFLFKQRHQTSRQLYVEIFKVFNIILTFACTWWQVCRSSVQNNYKYRHPTCKNCQKLVFFLTFG